MVVDENISANTNAVMLCHDDIVPSLNVFIIQIKIFDP
jgi:hypothetical protein